VPVFAHRLMQRGVPTGLRHCASTFYGLSIVITVAAAIRPTADAVEDVRRGLRA
jgi:hypothetical protein